VQWLHVAHLTLCCCCASCCSCDQTLITAFEAEQLIEQLQATDIEQVDSSKFMKQHDAIQKLNLQVRTVSRQTCLLSQ
jgi:L-lactate utilization protein LutB